VLATQQVKNSHELDLIVKWEQREWQGQPYEFYYPPIPCSMMNGPIVGFCREVTDDSNRVQYDLYVEVMDSTINEVIVYGVGTNLYDAQVTMRIKEVISRYKEEGSCE